MKKLMLTVMFFGMILVAAESATAQNCRPEANQIAVYTDSSYKGKCTIKNIGDYRSSESIGLPNDSISSILVGTSVLALVCEDNNFGGNCQNLVKSYSNFGNVTIGHDRVSSIKVVPKNYFKGCAKEGETCNFTGMRDVAYGANGIFKVKANVSGRIDCGNATFGDPIPGKPKWCYISNAKSAVTAGGNGAPKPPPNYQFCSNEGERCDFGSSDLTSVAFGSNGKYKYRSVKVGVECSTRIFGDPAPGQRKHCFVFMRSNTPTAAARYAPPDSSFRLCANEGWDCKFNGKAVVAFGVNGKFNYRNNAVGGIKCASAEFGNIEPGVMKRCYFKAITETRTAAVEGRYAPPSSAWVECAKYGAKCIPDATGKVAYGVNGVFKYSTIRGPFYCDKKTLGDPVPGFKMRCYSMKRK